MSGIRAEVRIDSPPNCLVAAVSEVAGAECTAVSWTGGSDSDGTITEEFMVKGDPGQSPQTVDGFDQAANEIFEFNRLHTYRFERSPSQPCPCAVIEEFDSPLREVHARRGALIVVFNVMDIQQLRTIIEGLRERWEHVSVHRLVRSGGDREVQQLVLVDRAALTDRQREVLRTAQEMGYFDHPKRANAGEVADELGINASTFTEHLSAAQRKLLGAIMDE